MSWHTPSPCRHCGQDVILTAAGWIAPQNVDPSRCPNSPTPNKIHQGQS